MASSKIRASKNHHKDHKKSGSRSNAHKELAKVEPKNDDDDYKTRYAKFSNDLEEKQIALVEKWVSYDMDTFEGHPAYREEWDKFLVKWKKDLNQPGKELSRLNLQRLKTDWLTFWIGRRVKELWNQELRQLHQTILRTHGFDGFPDPPADRLPKEVGSVGGTDPSKSSPPVRGASAKDEGTEHKGNDDSTVGIAKDAGGAVVKKEPCSCVAEIFDFFGKHFGRKGANDEEKRATNYAHLKCCLIVLLGVLGDIESFKKHVPRYVVDRIKTLSEKAMAAQKGGGEDACLSFLCQPENVHALSTAMTFLGRCAKAGVCKGWRVERFIDVSL
ncbi:unnamed protein product [Notodromas monacha]|uniref:Uncharacterized protein n=1 Tax=Notodromas monacha TaxID=399045 RepID=A0A7R9GJE5_9CRUS|nr:unnamed protein product [Notodromas monacha]CAG0923575.1 unnamed protein product [Notodromas monacha]